MLSCNIVCAGAAHDVHHILRGFMESVALAIKDGAVVKHEDSGVSIDLFRIPPWFCDEVMEGQPAFGENRGHE